MTEVKTSTTTTTNSSLQKGLFATVSYREGDIILTEDQPLAILYKESILQTSISDYDETDSGTLVSYLIEKLSVCGKESKEREAASTTRITETRNTTATTELLVREYLMKEFAKYQQQNIPTSSASLLVDNENSRLNSELVKAMIRVGFCYLVEESLSAQQNNDDLLFSLYAPPMDENSSLEEERPLVESATQALNFLSQCIMKNDAIENKDKLMKLMLIYACNAFEQGRIYEKTSRINHSCQPNAVVIPLGEGQRIQATTDISPGEEIFISYLDLLLYADRSTRQQELLLTKFFHCKCTRCNSQQKQPDPSTAIPCPSCHPRYGSRQLDEDVQYDDDHTVKYAFKVGDDSYVCGHCKSSINSQSTSGTNILSTIDRVQNRVLSYLKERKEPKTDAAEDATNDDGVSEEHVSLASSTLGARHWTTNILLLIHLSESLENFHAESLETDEDPDLTTVAEFVDTLQRLVRFVDGLDGLSEYLHQGHLLSDVTIGVARALVSLGDVKSQKYASEWLEPILDYVNKFESEGIQKVTESLSCAWRREEKPAAKKQKV